MSDKKSMSTLAAKAVARVKEQTSYTGKWGTGEHLALLRYMALDAVTQANANIGKPRLDKAGKPVLDAKGQPAVHTQLTAMNAILSDAFRADPELGYASNFDKLLKKMGEIPEGNDYE